MSSLTSSSWTPISTSVGGRKTTAATLDKDVCATCQKKLPTIDENLLKHSLRMKSEVAQMNTQKKSLLQMMAKNDDFVYPITPRDSFNARSCTSHSMAATSKLIDDDKHNSVMNYYAQVMRNRELHDCEKVHTHSRKREYKRWDYSHKDVANYYLKPMTEQVLKWLEEDEEARSHKTEEEIKAIEERSMGPAVGGLTSRNVVTGRGTSRRELESKDGEEDLPEAERVQLAIDKIRKETEGGMLTEIHHIKDRHRQLEALTETKKRAMADNVKAKPQRKQKTEPHHEKDVLRRYLLANANLQKDLEFNAFKEKTTVKLNRNFSDKATEAKDPGVVWAPKWECNKSKIPGKISKSTHPVSDANKKERRATFIPAKKGDLPACVYLPKHIEAKTAVESALLLQRFIKETCNPKTHLKTT